MKIICHEKDINGEEHGVFEVTPANLLKMRGCPKCKIDKYSYEGKIYYILCQIFGSENIIRQYTNYELLGRLSLDFFLPKYNLAIEHQGSQHFKPVSLYGGEEKFSKTCQRDKIKYQICLKNGIKLLYFTFEGNTVPNTYIDKVYTDIVEFQQLLLDIKKNYE